MDNPPYGESDESDEEAHDLRDVSSDVEMDPLEIDAEEIDSDDRSASLP